MASCGQRGACNCPQRHLSCVAARAVFLVIVHPRGHTFGPISLLFSALGGSNAAKTSYSPESPRLHIRIHTPRWCTYKLLGYSTTSSVTLFVRTSISTAPRVSPFHFHSLHSCTIVLDAHSNGMPDWDRAKCTHRHPSCVEFSDMTYHRYDLRSMHFRAAMKPSRVSREAVYPSTSLVDN